MRFMMFMIPGVYQSGSEYRIDENFAPSAEMVAQMMKYNEDLAKAGVLLSLDGLQPPAKGARIAFLNGVNTVKDGPFAESKEVVGGYWIISVNSKEEAVEWARRCPAQSGDMIEVRQIFEMSDFPADVQEAAKSDIIKES